MYPAKNSRIVYPFPMSSTVRWDHTFQGKMQWSFQTLVAPPTCATVPCISWKTRKRNFCHLDWTFNIRTLNWTFTYGIGLEEENKFKKFNFELVMFRLSNQFYGCTQTVYEATTNSPCWKKTSPAFRRHPPPPPSFPPAKKRHVVW